MSSLPALITAITALVTAIAGVVALLLHKSSPAHQTPPPAPPAAKP